MSLAETLLAIDAGTNLAFSIIEIVQRMKQDPDAITSEQAKALIDKWQPLVDDLAEDIKNL